VIIDICILIKNSW